MHSDKRRGKTRSRILYWFRTPPGVKIGRAALDDDAIRQIEELNPFVEFDWPRILKGQDQPPSEPRVPVEVRRSRGDRGGDRNERRQERSTPRPEPPRADPAKPGPERAAEAPEPPTIAADESEAEFSDFKEALQQQEDVIVAAHAKIGAEGVARLRARHAEIKARIAERITDPTRREELEAQANRLSPDAWITDADVTQGLDQYESVLASLREVVGRKRRRRRRGGGRGQTSEPAEASESREEPEDTGL